MSLQGQKLQEDDYLVRGNEVLVAEHVSTAGMVPRIERNNEGEVIAVCLVPTTGGTNNHLYCVEGGIGEGRRAPRRLPQI